jgi:phosphoglycerol transferase MdoB-like AlkP superfamily enzyme
MHLVLMSRSTSPSPLDADDRRFVPAAWLPAALLVGAVYLVAGLGFGALARDAATTEARTAWRLAAWAVSAVAFAAHIWYERARRRSSPAVTAHNAALAVALGAFGLAVAAALHGQATHHRFPLWALVVWPVLAALPAFVVALVTAALLARVCPSRSP